MAGSQTPQRHQPQLPKAPAPESSQGSEPTAYPKRLTRPKASWSLFVASGLQIVEEHHG
jgi:hypothetical protein